MRPEIDSMRTHPNGNLIRASFSLMVLAFILAGPMSVFGDERFVAPLSFGPVSASFNQPVIATDGQTFLAAWIQMGNYSGSRIVVQRLDQASPTSVPTTVFAGSGVAFGALDLAWTGSSYMLVYTDRAVLNLIRLDSAGFPISGTHRVLTAGVFEARIAAHADAALIVIRTGSPREATVALALNEKDEVVRREEVFDSEFTFFDVEAADSGFIVIVSSESGLVFVRLDRAGRRLDGEPRLIMAANGTGADLYRPRQCTLATAGSRTVIVWVARTYAGRSDLFSSIIDSSGQLSPAVALPHSASVIGSIDLVREEAGYQLLLTGGNSAPNGSMADFDLQLLRMDDEGRAASAPDRIGSTGVADSSARLARNRNGYGVVWKTDPIVNWSATRVVGVTAASLDLRRAPVTLSKTVADQLQAELAGDGLGYMVAWLEQLADRRQIIAARLDAQGKAVGDPLILLEAPPPSFISRPRVVYGHGMYLIAWSREGGVWGIRVDGEGRRVDAEPIRISGVVTGYSELDLTTSPTGFFVVWTSDIHLIEGAELTSAGPSTPHAVTIPLPVRQPDYRALEVGPQVAFNGESYLLSYIRIEGPPCMFPNCPSWEQILLTRLDRNGVPNGPPAAIEGSVRDIVSTAGDFALLQSTRVSLLDRGTLTISRSVPNRSDLNHHAALIANGSSYRLVWPTHPVNGRIEMFQQFISRDGRASDPTVIGTIGPGEVFDIRVAGSLGGDVMAVYSRRPEEAPFNGAARVVAQPLAAVDQPAFPRRRAARR